MAAISGQATDPRISEADVMSPRFDQAGARADHKVIVCSAPRTCSWALCRILLNLGIGLPAEYLNTLHVEPCARRWGVWQDVTRPIDEHTPLDDARAWLHVAPHAYAQALLENRTAANGVFSAKIHWEQLEPILARNQAAAARLFDDATCIWIRRSDVLGQAISMRVAAMTGNYGFDDSLVLNPVDIPLRECASRLLYQDWMWRRFFEANGIEPLVVNQSTLETDATAACRRIRESIGLGFSDEMIARMVSLETEQGPYRNDRDLKREEMRAFSELLTVLD